MLYQLSYRGKKIPADKDGNLAGATGFEPATSGVTGQRPKPLGHAPTCRRQLTPPAVTYSRKEMVPQTRVELVTLQFSVACSTN